MQADISLLTLFWQASIIVKLVMLMLLIMSIISWVIIFNQGRELRQTGKQARHFEDTFWNGGDLNQLYQESSAKQKCLLGMELLFYSGFKEYLRLCDKQVSCSMPNTIDNVHRAMRVTLSREIDNLEIGLPTLATIGSVSPYVGLFGTVWGIMNAFIALGAMQQATLTMVAPGIAEALIATAMGLFAAIPAVIAYNRYTTATSKLENSYINFIEEFTNILQRQKVIT